MDIYIKVYIGIFSHGTVVFLSLTYSVSVKFSTKIQQHRIFLLFIYLFSATVYQAFLFTGKKAVYIAWEKIQLRIYLFTANLNLWA